MKKIRSILGLCRWDLWQDCGVFRGILCRPSPEQGKKLLLWKSAKLMVSPFLFLQSKRREEIQRLLNASSVRGFEIPQINSIALAKDR